MDLPTARQFARLLEEQCYESPQRNAIIDDLHAGTYDLTKNGSLLTLRVCITALCEGQVPGKITDELDSIERRFAPKYATLSAKDVEELQRAAAAQLTLDKTFEIKALDLTGEEATTRDSEAMFWFCQDVLRDNRFIQTYTDEGAIKAAKEVGTAAEQSDLSQQ